MEHPDELLPGLRSGDEAFALLDALWESSPLGFAYFDTALRYRRVNGAVLAVDGGSVDDRLGRTLAEVHGPTGEVLADVLRAVLTDGRPHLDVAVRGRLWHGAGPLQEWRVNAYPVRRRTGPGEGSLMGLGLVVRDVTTAEDARREIRRTAAEREHALVRYQSLVEAARAAVWVRGIDGSAERDAPGLRGLTGQTFAEMRGFGFLDAVHPEHRAAWWAAWEQAARAAAVFTHEYRLRTATGGYRWFRSRAVPVHVGGRVVEWVGTETDSDDEIRARARLEVLARATVAVTGIEAGHDAPSRPDEELAALADVLVPGFADVCRVYLLDPPRGGSVTGRRSTTRVAEGTAEPVMSGRFVFGVEHPIARCVHTAAAVLAEVSTTPGPEFTPSAAQTRWGVDIAAHSLIAAPVLVGGAVVAVLLLLGCGDRGRYTEEDRALVGEVAQRASVAVERAAALQLSRHVAVTLQSAMLTEPPQPPWASIHGTYLPAAAGLAVGGDWFDAFDLPGGGLAIGVGDVAGHDLPAATTMGQLRSMLRALADADAPPSAAVASLDRVATRLGVTRFTTLVHGHLRPVDDGAVLRWSNAGHPLPVLAVPGEPARYLTGTVDVVLGVAPELPRHDQDTVLPPGSTLVLYTDGLLERRDDPDDEAAADLLAAVDAAVHLPPATFCDELVRTSSADTDDDVVVLAVRLVSR